MSTKVTYKDRDGKRRTKVVRVPGYARIEDAIRELCNVLRLSPRTYICSVHMGASTYLWRDTAYDAFTPEQLKAHKYWD